MRATPTTMYVRLSNTRAKIYAGRVARCRMVSHVEYAPRSITIRKKTGQMDGRLVGWLEFNGAFNTM